MKYNWQKKGWPNFNYTLEKLKVYEIQFANVMGRTEGVLKYVDEHNRKNFFIDMMCTEAMNTSEIEGEMLTRDSVKSSLRKNFGLQVDARPAPLREKGIADLLTDLYINYHEEITQDKLHHWNRLILQGRYDIDDIGRYRTHEDPMQIVSGSLNYPVVHFEAPPSALVESEMKQFLNWLNNTPQELEFYPLVKAGVAHLYFVCIHPYEDGNGRVARAISEKVIFEHMNRPIYISISQQIHKLRDEYYYQLERNNKDLDITEWLVYFSEMVLKAQDYSEKMVDFLMHKTLFFDRNRDRINDRQEKVINRIFREGLEGFKGGLSAKNYISITQTSRATATRDLQDLVDKGILYQTGERKSARYFLRIPY